MLFVFIERDKTRCSWIKCLDQTEALNFFL